VTIPRMVHAGAAARAVQESSRWRAGGLSRRAACSPEVVSDEPKTPGWVASHLRQVARSHVYCNGHRIRRGYLFTTQAETGED